MNRNFTVGEPKIWGYEPQFYGWRT